jgi:hypothetical protein
LSLPAFIWLFFIPLSLCFIRIALFLKIKVRRQVSFSQGTSIPQVGGTIWRLNFLEWLFGSFVLRVYLVSV